MLKNNKRQTKNQHQSLDQLTEKELLLIYGGDPTGLPSTPGSDENG
jgi:hypothetical protein